MRKKKKPKNLKDPEEKGKTDIKKSRAGWSPTLRTFVPSNLESELTPEQFGDGHWVYRKFCLSPRANSNFSISSPTNPKNLQYAAYKRLNTKDTQRLKLIGWKIIVHVKGNDKKIRVSNIYHWQSGLQNKALKKEKKKTLYKDKGINTRIVYYTHWHIPTQYRKT